MRLYSRHINSIEERLFTSRSSKDIRDKNIYERHLDRELRGLDSNKRLTSGGRKFLEDDLIERANNASKLKTGDARKLQGKEGLAFDYQKSAKRAERGGYTQTRGQKKVRGNKISSDITNSYISENKKQLEKRLGTERVEEARRRIAERKAQSQKPEVKITEPRPNVSAEVIPTTPKPQTPTIVHTEPKPVVKPNPELTNNFTNTKKPTSKFSFKRLTEKFKSNGRSIFGRMNKGDIKNFLKSKLKRLIRR